MSGAWDAPDTIGPAEAGAAKKAPSPTLPRYAGEGAPARIRRKVSAYAPGPSPSRSLALC